MDRWMELATTTFSEGAELASWAASRDMGITGLQGSEEAIALAARIGEAVRGLALALAEGRRPSRELSALDEVVSSVNGRMRVGLAGVAFVADAAPLVQVPLRLGLEAAAFALDPDHKRVGVCERDDCGRFFVDRSRDGRGRWCSSTCGSAERVRRLRRRGA